MWPLHREKAGSGSTERRVLFDGLAPSGQRHLVEFKRRCLALHKQVELLVLQSAWLNLWPLALSIPPPVHGFLFSPPTLSFLPFAPLPPPLHLPGSSHGPLARTGLREALVDGGDGGAGEPAVFGRAAGLGLPAHHAEEGGLLLAPLLRYSTHTHTETHTQKHTHRNTRTHTETHTHKHTRTNTHTQKHT